MIVELEEIWSNLPLPKFWTITCFLNWFRSDSVLTAGIVLRPGQEGAAALHPTFQRAPQVTKRMYEHKGTAWLRIS